VITNSPHRVSRAACRLAIASPRAKLDWRIPFVSPMNVALAPTRRHSSKLALTWAFSRNSSAQVGRGRIRGPRYGAFFSGKG
jgi:hypothetical protein